VKRFSDLVIRLRGPVITATIAVTLALGYCIKDVRINSDILSYLPKTDPAVQLNEHVGELNEARSLRWWPSRRTTCSLRLASTASHG
jgi:hypothetical protein